MKKIALLLLLVSLGGIILAEQDVVNVIMKTNYGDIYLELYPKIAPKTVENFVGLATGTKEWTDPKTGEKVKRPLYNGTIFHRVIKDFMIQGGDPLGNGTGGPGYRFEDECYDDSGDEITGKITDDTIALMVFQQILLPYVHSTKTPDAEIKHIVDECVRLQSGEPIKEHTIEYFKEKTNFDKPFKTPGKLKATVDYGTICMANSGPNTNGSQFFIVTKKEGCDWLNGKHTVFGKVTKGMDVVHKIENLKTDAHDRPLDENKAVIEEIIVK